MNNSAIQDRSTRSAWWILASLMLLFMILRLPVIVCQIPAQDEDYFAVPGWTILEEGIPRIPYMPSRDPESAFYRADTMLFSLPPLYFYVQSLFYLVFGASTVIARLVCLVCGVLSALVLFCFTRELTQSRVAALGASGLYMFSRVIYFPSVVARPDLLCSLLGLIALYCVNDYAGNQRVRFVALAGLSAGLGMLAHPFALVFCLQAGVWLLIIGAGWKEKLRRASLFAIVALATFSLWGLLIVQHPDLFQTQFTNNVLGRSGPGLIQRLFLPFDSFRAQVPLYIVHNGILQAVLLGLGTLVVICLAIKTRERKFVVPAVLTCSGIYLHIACQGTHPTKGYWVYTCAWQYLCVGIAIAELAQRIGQHLSKVQSRLASVLAVIVFAGVMLPGSGVRTFWVYATHGNETDYNAPRFAETLMKRFEKDQRLVVDPGYVFDFHRAGYDVLLGLNYKPFYDVAGEDYAYFVAGPTSIRDGVAEDLQAIEMLRLGNFDDPFACRSILYRHPEQAERNHDE